MTEETSHLLNNINVKTVQITLDGDRALYNRTRFDNPETNSFDRILKNIL